MSIVMPSFYAGPVQYYALMIRTRRVTFEVMEHFIKQTPRNRCTIDSPNNTVILSTPIKKTGDKMPMRNVELSREEDWSRVHWQALKSAYGTSPYFDLYDYLFEPVFENPPLKLVDRNTALHRIILRCLDHEQHIAFTDHFTPIEGEDDNRVRFNAKQHQFKGELPPYRQVFDRKHGFRKNLSVLDLIFNLGPEARTYLLGIEI